MTSNREREPGGEPSADGLGEQRQASESLRASEALLRQFIASTPAAVAMFDREMRYLHASDRWISDYRLEGVELLGRSHYEVFPELPERWKEVHRRALAGAHERCEEDSFPRADGTLDWLHWDVQPWRDAAGEIGGLIMFTQAITDRKRAEVRLRESEERFRALSDNSLVGVYVHDGERVTYVNPAVERIFGYPPGELLGQHPHVVIHPDDRSLAAAVTLERLAGQLDNVGHDVRGIRKDGTTIHIAVYAFAADLGGQRCVIGNVLDLTERVHAAAAREQAEAELLRSEQRWRTLIEDAPVAIGMQRDGVVIYVNRKFRELWRFPSPAAAVGVSIDQLWTAPFGEVVREQARRRDLGETASSSYEHLARRPDGTTFLAHADVVNLELPDGPAGIAFVTDITERESLERQLRQSQKMEAIGVLAGGVAHDFNNLLAVILSYTRLVVDELPAGDPRAADLKEVEHAAERAAQLTRQLLAFSRQQVAQPHVVDLNDVLVGSEKMLRRLIGEHIQLATSTSPVPASAFVDPGQLEQVLMNLVVNARDAMPDGGRLMVDVAVVTLAEPDPLRQLAAGRHVVLSVADSGAGIEEHLRTRIFEPFFTTKEVGKGTGLGLSTVFGIVKQSGGYIDVHSEVGRGSRFEVWLPYAEDTRGAQVASVATAAERGGETVMVVEDDDAVRRLVCSVLTRHGYTALECRSPGDALVVSEQYRSTIHLLLTDIVMPLMRGDQLYERLRGSRPALRVAFMSGYPDRGGDGPTSFPPEQFLPKPFTPVSLLQRVRAILT